MLAWILFIPLVLAFLVLILPVGLERWHRPLALVGSLLVAVISLKLWYEFDGSSADYQFRIIQPWLTTWGITFQFGVDGISLPLLLLTTLMAPIALVGTWPKNFQELKHERFFVFCVLLLQTGMIGTFISLDLFLFYIFWELVLIPMYFLIGIWGGKERIYATVKFFLYTVFGSLLMLVAIFWLLSQHHATFGFYSASFLDLKKLVLPFEGEGFRVLLSPQGLAFLAFSLAFAIKVPLFPFHTWLPDAHVQAPTIGSVFLAAVLLKMGTYGFMRLAIPFFPEAAQAAAPLFLALACIGIVYGALVALAQTDLKKLVAYSSVSHMGFVILGLFSFNIQGVGGALYQMVNHGIATGGLFLIVGFLYERRHTRELSAYGGLGKITPTLATCFMIVLLSSIALPGTNGFVGEFPILLGAFQKSWIAATIAGTGVILGAVYMLKSYQTIVLGPVTHSENKALPDLSSKELTAMLVLAFFIFGIGFFPQAFFGKSQVALEHWVSQLRE